MSSVAFATDPRFAAHTMPQHPENAARLEAVVQQLHRDRLWERLLHVPIEAASDEAITAVHTPAYLARLARTEKLGGLAMWGADTYITPASYRVARLAAGAVVRVVDAVLSGEAQSGIAAVRPPGHHATPDEAMGFCLLNNVAIAARHALRAHGLARVLIVDYDVHHGNGTQDVFYDDPAVLYISTHQSPLYPGTGRVKEIGRGAGEGYTVNIPMPPGVGDAGYRRVFDEVIVPLARRFAPQLVLVSLGLDAHWGDPLANMRLSLAGYDVLARTLFALASELCEGRIVFVAEGGYNVQALAHGWANVTRALLGAGPPVDPLGAATGEETPISSVLKRVKRIHKLNSY